MTITAPVATTDTLPEFDVACALHELLLKGEPCGRSASLVVRVHGCAASVSCRPCWRRLQWSMKRTRAAAPPFHRSYRCKICKRSAKKLKDLVWAEPL